MDTPVLESLARLLCSPLRVTKVEFADFNAGAQEPAARVPTSRMILLQAGEIDYSIGGTVVRLHPRSMIFVPAWYQRQWVVPPGCGGCRLAWSEFIVDSPLQVPIGPHTVFAEDPDVEESAFSRMAATSLPAAGLGEAYRLEGELKAILGRFFSRATPVRTATSRRDGTIADPRLQAAVHWLQQNLSNPQAVQEVHRQVDLSPSATRSAFRAVTGLNVRAYVTKLRMESARYYLRQTSMSVKQVAQSVGYHDPLYFSRHYRQYWGYPATQERNRE